MRIGPFVLKNNLILAPMAGVTDRPFRMLCRRLGAGLAVSEMISCDSTLWSTPKSLKRLDHSGESAPVSVQIAGADPAMMGEAARMNVDRGAGIIDINMGCPAKKVTGGYSGSALMRDLDHALTLIDATVGAVSVPVTLKMRLGWDENTINAPELAKRAEDAGVRMITVHGRTRAQLYNGQADWRRVADVRDAVRIPLVVNGDIGCLADARRALALSGADAVMIGRAAYGQPWLSGEIAREAGFAGAGCMAAPRRDCMAAYVTSHYEDMLSQYGAETGTRHARKHLGWYLDRHAPISRDMSAIRKQIMTSNRSEEVIRLISVVLRETSNETALPAEAA
jgi:nifR3 family TIM-barrel protein